MTSRQRHRPEIVTPAAVDEVASLPTEHTHPLPRAFVWAGAALVVLTLAGILLLAAYAYSITARLAIVEQVIDARTADRDQQTADIRAELRDAVCDVLDRLPPSAQLDPLRAQYSCGPGISPEEIP